MAYPGGKAAVVHKLINLMPPHSTYVEAFLGGGAVMRSKRPAAYNIGVDLDAEVISGWRGENADTAGRNAGGLAAGDLVASPEVPIPSTSGTSAATRRRRSAVPPLVDPPMGDRFRFLRGDALTFLASYPFEPDALIYCDPPYLLETLASGRQRYRREFSDAQHAELLSTIRELPCRVMVSGYWSELYARELSTWNAVHFEAMTRGGYTATEWVWFNFPEPAALHDYRFLGETFRERQDLKRQRERWIARLEAMSVLKKRMLLSALAHLVPEESQQVQHKQDQQNAAKPNPATDAVSPRSSVDSVVAAPQHEQHHQRHKQEHHRKPPFKTEPTQSDPPPETPFPRS